MADEERPPGPPAFPRATYRVQFRKEFGFDEARELVPYLARLGISHLYASPFLAARAGSVHGYDIVDHNRFNPEVGDAAAFERLIAALHAHGMGLILDFVPNHMGIGAADNPWWLDLLEWGQASPYAAFFDINWSPEADHLKGKVLLPLLGDHYGNVLEKGEIQLRFDPEQGSFSAWYYNHRFPIAIRHYPRLLRLVQAREPAVAERLNAFIAAFDRIGRRRRALQAAAAARRDADAHRAELAAAVRADPALGAAIDAVLADINGLPGEPRSFRQLHELLERQAYHVAYWRVASNDINYRRFFDINDLAGLAIENPELFEVAHRLVFQLIAESKLQGLRLDHIDGLYDPADYCRRLQDRAAYLVMQAEGGSAPLRPPHPVYLLVEKILAGHEWLPGEWPVDGTTGYEFMNLVNGLFVDPAAADPLGETYERFIGRRSDFPEMVIAAKRQILRNNLSSELNVLTDMVHRIARQSLNTRDFTRQAVRDALIETISHFPVYRTYVTDGGISDKDRQYIHWAIAQARRDSTADDLTIFDFVQALLTTDLARERGRGYRRRDVVRVAMKFQQLTGPVMAKAYEDTTLYRFNRLVSLNEVGGEPDRFGTTPGAFHYLNGDRLKRSPFSMVSTATHDHKRGEDTRARIDVLSELPAEWARRVRRWSRLNRLKKREIDDLPAPGRNDEYLFYQVLVGAWPLHLRAGAPPDLGDLPDRMAGYMLKAAREAKARTNWTAPKPDYEQALEAFVHGVLDPERAGAFIADLADFADRIAPAGAVNGLAQALLRLTVPGVPDTYQGCELWDQSLVDPDNRRPVDYEARRRALAADVPLKELLASWRDGRVKQRVLARALDLRRRLPELFAVGDYAPLEAAGPLAERLVGFRRQNGAAAILVVVPRLCVGMLADGGLPRLAVQALAGTEILCDAFEGGTVLRDAITGREHRLGDDRRLPAADLLSDFPVALLATP